MSGDWNKERLGNLLKHLVNESQSFTRESQYYPIWEQAADYMCKLDKRIHTYLYAQSQVEFVFNENTTPRRTFTDVLSFFEKFIEGSWIATRPDVALTRSEAKLNGGLPDFMDMLDDLDASFSSLNVNISFSDISMTSTLSEMSIHSTTTVDNLEEAIRKMKWRIPDISVVSISFDKKDYSHFIKRVPILLEIKKLSAVAKKIHPLTRKSMPMVGSQLFDFAKVIPQTLVQAQFVFSELGNPTTRDPNTRGIFAFICIGGYFVVIEINALELPRLENANDVLISTDVEELQGANYFRFHSKTISHVFNQRGTDLSNDFKRAWKDAIALSKKDPSE